jgi:hypothetical protein
MSFKTKTISRNEDWKVDSCMIGFLSSWRISPTTTLIKDIVIQAGVGSDFRNPRFCHIIAGPRVWPAAIDVCYASNMLKVQDKGKLEYGNTAAK